MDTNRDNQFSKGEKVLTLWELVRLLLRKWHLLLAAGAVLALAVFLLLHFWVTPTYESRVSFYVYNTSDGKTSSGTINSSDLQAAESLATTYSEILASNSVLDAVLEDLGEKSSINRKDLSEMTEVSVVSDTQLLEVTVTSTDPKFACEIAKSFAKAAPKEMVRITKAGGVEVVDQPEVATEKTSPRTVLDTAVAFMVGVLLMMVAVILRTTSDTTLYLAEDVEELSDMTLLGQVPQIAAAKEMDDIWELQRGGDSELEVEIVESEGETADQDEQAACE